MEMQSIQVMIVIHRNIHTCYAAASSWLLRFLDSDSILILRANGGQSHIGVTQGTVRGSRRIGCF